MRDAGARAQAIEHNLECIALGAEARLEGADGLDRRRLQFRRPVEPRPRRSTAISTPCAKVYAGLPADWQVFLEHKLYEPAFYSTVISDWGSQLMPRRSSWGRRRKCLVDLGHHAPSVNIEQIVARLVRFGKLAGFHFNDCKYGDDDLDAGSIAPFQLFLVFNELVDAAERGAPGFAPAYMLDQSHNVSDPIESLMLSAIELQRAYAQALLVDRAALAAAQDANDALGAHMLVKQAYTTDVSPLLATRAGGAGGAIDPVARLSRFGLSRAQGDRAAGVRRRRGGDRLNRLLGSISRHGQPFYAISKTLGARPMRETSAVAPGALGPSFRHR